MHEEVLNWWQESKLEIYMGQSVLLYIWLKYGNGFAAIALRVNVIKKKW